MLFEIYERFDSVTASAPRLLAALAPPILGAIAADRAGPGAARLVADPQAPAGARGARGAARERDRGVEPGAATRRLLPPRRAGAGHRRRRLLARTAGRPAVGRGRAEEAGVLRAAIDACGTASATCARCSSTSIRRTSQPRGSRPRSATSSARSRRAGSRWCRRSIGDGAPRPGAGGARLPGRAGGAAQRDRLRGRRPGARRRHGTPASHGSSSPTTAAVSRPSSGQRRAEEGHLGLSLAAELARQSGGRARRRLVRRARARRVELEVPTPMIRVLIADDHGVLRDGLGRRDRGPAGHGARRRRGQRRRGGRALSADRPGRRADGSRDAGHGRDRGDSRDPPQRARRRRCSC